MTDEKYSDPILRSALNDVVFGRAIPSGHLGYLGSIGPRLDYLASLRAWPRNANVIRTARDDLRLMDVLSGTNVPGARRRLSTGHRYMQRNRMYPRYDVPWLTAVDQAAMRNRRQMRTVRRWRRFDSRRRRNQADIYRQNMMNQIRGLYE